MKKILIIEDDEDIALLIKESVEKIGHEGLLSPTGEDGVQKATQERSRILFMRLVFILKLRYKKKDPIPMTGSFSFRQSLKY